MGGGGGWVGGGGERGDGKCLVVVVVAMAVSVAGAVAVVVAVETAAAAAAVYLAAEGAVVATMAPPVPFAVGHRHSPEGIPSPPVLTPAALQRQPAGCVGRTLTPSRLRPPADRRASP